MDTRFSERLPDPRLYTELDLERGVLKRPPLQPHSRRVAPDTGFAPDVSQPEPEVTPRSILVYLYFAGFVLTWLCLCDDEGAFIRSFGPLDSAAKWFFVHFVYKTLI